MCNLIKPLEDFARDSSKKDGRHTKCKACKNKWNKENKELVMATLKKWKTDNPDKVRLYHRTYVKQKRKTDPIFKLAYVIRRRLYNALKGNAKKGKTVELLGCSIDSLKEHLQNKFLPGMTWQNHGKWHIDHIKPLSSFNLNDEKELKMACHFSNLQPLWATDNIKKSNK